MRIRTAFHIFEERERNLFLVLLGWSQVDPRAARGEAAAGPPPLRISPIIPGSMTSPCERRKERYTERWR